MHKHKTRIIMHVIFFSCFQFALQEKYGQIQVFP